MGHMKINNVIQHKYEWYKKRKKEIKEKEIVKKEKM